MKKSISLAFIALLAGGLASGAAAPAQAELSVNQEVMLCISKATTKEDRQACIDFWKERAPVQSSDGETGQQDLKAETQPEPPLLKRTR